MNHRPDSAEARYALWARAPIHARREDFLAPHLGPGRTLDVGCIDERKPQAIERSLHAWIGERCPDLVGVDADAAAATIARERGFDVLVRDACHDDLGGPYDRILAGEVVEHVPCVAALLANLVRHLAPGGRLLLTTPNATSLRQQGKILRKGHPQMHARHTAWFDAATLEETLQRAGLAVLERGWLAPPRGVLVRALARWRRPWNEGLLVVAEAVRAT